ncbi:MAG TPA: hypothetical protein VHR45_03095 [Thermoanaerobaculia bacterium]|nr:hypothetical protein [Thermoanaerobaculia bacterium]
MSARRRSTWLFWLPLLLALGAIALPLLRGAETLFLRDVLNTHLEMKWAQAWALHRGYFPILDPFRAGGQPLAGNPDAVPFYPTNLLYLWSSPFWALNAHFWIHLLLAPFAFFWLARRWGLAREPAWVAAACYAASGFYLSHLSFYNLIAGATLTPALIAACLALGQPPVSGRRVVAPMAPIIALLWALLLLGGDPMMAGLAALLAGSALLAQGVWRRPPVDGTRPAFRLLAQLAAAFGCGTLVALPQIVEFLRILPVSFRGFYGYSPLVATVASWDPRQAAEWLIPFLFGRLDLLGGGSFWGSRFYTDTPPYYPALYPGFLALALVAAGGRPRGRMAWWSWGAIAAGIFCSLGRFNPLLSWLFSLGGHNSLRYPVKFWMPVAVGAALCCGEGFARMFGEGGAVGAVGEVGDVGDVGYRAAWRRWFLVLAAVACLLGSLALFLAFFPDRARLVLRWLIPQEKTALFVAAERLRWLDLCRQSLAVVAALGLLAALARLRPRLAGLLVAAHALTQVLLLRPLYPTDAIAPYRVPPPALAYLPPGLTVVNPDFNYLFGPSRLKSGRFPAPLALWFERRAFYELYPFTGPLWGRRYELNEGPEGLDSFLTRMAQGAVKGVKDEQRLRLLATWGIGRLVIDRPLEPPAAGARLLAALPSFGQELYIYEVLGRAPEVFLARRILPAPHLNAAAIYLGASGFDRGGDVIIPGSGPPRPAGGGTARVLRRGPESLEVEVEVGRGGSVLAVQRALLLYRATVDGAPASVVAANLHHTGVEVPAGRHRVRLWVDRTRFHRALGAAALGLALLPALGWWPGTGGRRPLLRSPVGARTLVRAPGEGASPSPPEGWEGD